MDIERNVLENTQILGDDDRVNKYVNPSCDETIFRNYINPSCDESVAEKQYDRPNLWYILPMILKDKDLYDMSNILDISNISLNEVSIIKISYKKDKIPAIKGKFENESCYYNNYESDNCYNVSYSIPSDKTYLFEAISRRGVFALNIHLIQKYFKLL